MNPKTLVHQTYASLADRYDGCERINGLYARHLAQALAPRAGHRILDLAAGTGLCTRALRECAPDLSITAVDLTREMLAQAQKKLGTNAQFSAQDAECLAFADASFDIVNCGMGIYLFPNLPVALREMYRVTRAGGRVGVSIPGRGLPEVEQTLENFFQNHKPGAPRRSQPDTQAMALGIEYAIALTGFSNVQSRIVHEQVFFPNVQSLAEAMEGSGVRKLFLRGADRSLSDSEWQELLATFQRVCRTPNGLILPVQVILVTGERA